MYRMLNGGAPINESELQDWKNKGDHEPEQEGQR